MLVGAEVQLAVKTNARTRRGSQRTATVSTAGPELVVAARDQAVGPAHLRVDRVSTAVLAAVRTKDPTGFADDGHGTALRNTPGQLSLHPE